MTHSVDEAVFLADRVFLLSSQPGRLLNDFSVNVSRPRIRTDPKLVKIRQKLLEALVREIGVADGQIGRRRKR